MSENGIPINAAGAGAGEPVVIPVEPIALEDPQVARAIALIYREATTLDAKAYHAWERLYADDATYVIPVVPGIHDFENHLNMVFDDKRLQHSRVVRLTEGYAMSAVDSAITARTVSNFVAQAVSGDTVELTASQVLIAYKRGVHDIWAGTLEFSIRIGASSADDRIVKKVIRLVNSNETVPASGFLL